MEAGFTQQQWSCLGDRIIPGGIDTLLAEHMLHFMCGDDTLQIMDFCGGHATPYELPPHSYTHRHRQSRSQRLQFSLLLMCVLDAGITITSA